MITAFVPFLFVLNGCSDAVQPVDPTMPASLVVTSASPEVGVDSSVAVKAVAVNSNGNPVAATLHWSVSDSMVAVVSNSGVVSGRSAGTVMVSATSGSAVGTTPIKVRQTNAAGPVAPATGPGLSGVAFAYDDFTTYRSTAELIADVPSGDGTATSNPKYANILKKELITLDGTVRYNGHATVRYSQPGGTSATPEFVVKSFAARDKIWIRSKIRYSPGYTTVGTGRNFEGNVSSAAYKLMGWMWAGLEGRGTLDFSNTNEYQLSWDLREISSAAAPSGAPLGPFAIRAAGNATAEWTDGAWYDMIVNFEKLTETTTRTRVWITKDGETPVLRATVDGVVTTAGRVAPGVVFVTPMGMNYNQVRRAGQDQALWWGQWEVVDGSKYSNPFGVR